MYFNLSHEILFTYSGLVLTERADVYSGSIE